MCAYSMIMDWYGDKWDKLPKPDPVPSPPPFIPYVPPYPVPLQPPPITPEEIEEFRRLLERAREYDKRTGQSDCELESKKERIRKLAEELGIQIDFL